VTTEIFLSNQFLSSTAIFEDKIREISTKIYTEEEKVVKNNYNKSEEIKDKDTVINFKMTESILHPDTVKRLISEFINCGITVDV
jgi:hypothetical protein